MDARTPPASTGRQASMAFILLTVFMSVLGIGLVVPVLPQLITELAGDDLATGARTYGLFVAVYAAMQFLFAPVLGALSDRFGRRPVLLVSVFGAGLDYLVMALAPGIVLLFAARAVAGLTAANITVANAYIADITPAPERARRFGLVGAAFGLGFIIAPAIGGLLGSYGLRVPFFAAAAVTLINWLYGFFVLPESLPLARRRRFVLRRASPLGSIARLRAFRGVPSLAVVVMFSAMAQQLLQTIWVLFTGLRFGWGPLENGLALAFLGVTTALMQGAGIRPLLARFGERRAIALGLSASIAAYTLYALVPLGWMLFPVMAIGSLGGLTGPALQGRISRAVSEDEQGGVQGALASLGSLAAIVSPIVATALFALFTAPHAPLTLPGAPFLLGALLLAAGLALAQRATRTEPEGARVAGATTGD